MSLANKGADGGHKPLNANIDKIITINKKRADVYAVFRNLEGLTKYIKPLKKVRIINKKESEWEAEMPSMGNYKWTITLIEDVPGKLISWEVLTAKGSRAEGSFKFTDVGTNATEVLVSVAYHSPLGRLTNLFNPVIENRAQDGIDDFVSAVEKG